MENNGAPAVVDNEFVVWIAIFFDEVLDNETVVDAIPVGSDQSRKLENGVAREIVPDNIKRIVDETVAAIGVDKVQGIKIDVIVVCTMVERIGEVIFDNSIMDVGHGRMVDGEVEDIDAVAERFGYRRDNIRVAARLGVGRTVPLTGVADLVGLDKSVVVIEGECEAEDAIADLVDDIRDVDRVDATLGVRGATPYVILAGLGFKIDNDVVNDREMEVEDAVADPEDNLRDSVAIIA